MTSRHQGWLTSRLFWFVTVALVGSVAGCAPETRYRVLTIFFEGAPPPGARGAGEGALPRGPGELADPVSFHPDFLEEDCTACHLGRRRFVHTPAPDLCWTCHEAPPASDPWLHGPARTGMCMSCHVPHESLHPALLVAVGPELCYRCHRDTFVQALPAHQGVNLASCTECHRAHEGGTVGVPRRVEAPLAPLAPEAPTTGTVPRRPVPGPLPEGVAPLLEDEPATTPSLPQAMPPPPIRAAPGPLPAGATPLFEDKK